MKTNAAPDGIESGDQDWQSTDDATTPVPDEGKLCGRCVEVKPRNAFGHRAASVDGLQSWCKACKAAYHAARPEIKWEAYFRERCGKFGIEPVVESFTRADLIAAYGDSCSECGGNFDQIDHVVPVSLGGPHTLENVRPICEACHKAKNIADMSAIVAQRNGTRVPGADEKSCSDCKRVLPRSDFNRSAARLDGLKGYCRKCHRDRSRRYRANGTSAVPIDLGVTTVYSGPLTFR